MITTRLRALEKLNILEKELATVRNNSGITILGIEVSDRYIELIYEIRKNIKYSLNIANVKGTHDKVLGYVDIKRIEQFVRDNSSLK